MDFANERYVRLYVRDTTTTRLLRWEAQAVYLQILRFVDRAGVLDLSGVSAVDAVAAALPKWPRAVIEAAIGDIDDPESLLGRKVLEVGNDALVWPKFIEAQDTPQSEAHRKREERARRRDLARLPVTKRDDASEMRTDGHGASREVTQRQDETNQDETNKIEPPSPLAAPASCASLEIPGTDSPRVSGPAPKPRNPDIAEQVIALLRDAVRRVTGESKGPRDSQGNRRMIATATKRERATLADWEAVIAAQERSVKGNPEAWKYLCLSTITRPSNWARLADAPVSRGTRGPVDPGSQDHDAEVPF